MDTINLDPNFRPFGKSLTEDISRPFPSGAEVNFRLGSTALPKEIRLTARIRSSDEIMRLLFATDACKRAGAKELHLFIPYLPYARQDRVCNEGESFALKVFANVVNDCGFASVTMFDPHSDVSGGVVTNALVLNNHAFVKVALKGSQDYYLVSPDAGASKKVQKVAHAIGHNKRPVMCSKYRIESGYIESVEISQPDFFGKEVFILDDICDGGATFIKLAEELKLRNAGKVNLVVSHGIFSKGLAVLKNGGIDHVFTTDSFQDQDTSGGFLTEVKLCDIL
jgi:ribose-phosphate pyrophosphokinase